VNILKQRLIVVSICMMFLLVFGTVGYMSIEGWRFFDSIYMTVITMSTVGFQEIEHLTDAGRMFSMILIILSWGTAGIAFGYLTQALIHGEIRRNFWRRRVEKKIDHMQEHYIICGYGRCGAVVCDEMEKQDIDYVVVESGKELILELEEKNINVIEGNATDEEVLEKAGVGHAKGLVTSVSSDADNVFIILSARELNPDIFIVARAIDASAESKLRRAGANRVVMPYILGGKRMANAIMRPDVVDLLDFAFVDPKRNILMEQFVVSTMSPVAEKSLRESNLRSKYGLVVIGIKRPDGKLLFNPDANEVMHEGDLLILMGDMANLKHVKGDAKLST